MARKKKLTEATVGDLRPAPYNPRRISAEKLAILEKTIRELGDVGGVIFNRRTGRLIGGHQRAKVFGPEAEITFVEEFDPPTDAGTVGVGFIRYGGERHAYRVVDWPEPLEMAANVAANNGVGEWDIALLKDLVQELDTGVLDMELTGFSEEELKRLLAPVHPDEDEGPDTRGKGDPKTVICPECGCDFELGG